MHTYVKKLQSKEENTRKQILLGSLIVSMTIVGSIWIYSLSDKFGEDKDVAQTSTEESVSPFKLFANSIVSTYHDITASVGNISLKKKNDQTEGKQIDLIVVDHPTVK